MVSENGIGLIPRFGGCRGSRGLGALEAHLFATGLRHGGLLVCASAL